MSHPVQHLVDTAEASIQAAAEIADADPKRPRYHFRAPGQWMDDPNGIIYHDGMYHMMYSLNPQSAEHRAGMVYKTAVRVWDPTSPDWTGGITVWGHARSWDMVAWEHCPIALYPSIDKGEHFIWFGCTVINDDGVPMAIYTAIGPDMRPEDTAQQWAALGDAELLTWHPMPSNPLMTDAIHGEQVVREWRDPFLFKEGGRTFMILGGQVAGPDGNEPVVTLYEAKNAAYTAWDYRGIVFRHPRKGAPSAECPNLARVDGKWVLLLSPHGAVEYFVGDLDLDVCTFTVETSGVVDHSTNFYATNVLFDATGRCIMWAAVEGFKETSGWNGCVSLPRQLNVTPDGVLLQAPVQELQRLRGRVTSLTEAPAIGGTAEVGLIDNGGTLELLAVIEHQADAAFGLRFGDGVTSCDVAIGPDAIRIGDLQMPSSARGERTKLHVMIDRTVLELYVNDRTCATRIIPLLEGPIRVELFSRSGRLRHVSLQLWELQADDLFTSFKGRSA